ncbi:hypothetical protein JB92DRAFT_2704341 [Gautieria morchelliformis]|nr:hypothetical protein JB92DRAFT_2704341 [Gautieria morchelliformis]
MQGVRRWIGANPVSSPRRSKKQATSADEVREPPPEAKVLDPASIEGVVARLLPPTVSEAEVTEYQWYVEQYQSLLTAPSTGAQRQDLELYWSSVRTAAGDTNGLVEEVAPENEYVAYLEGGWGLATESAGKFNYEKWISSAQRKLTEDLA